MKNITLHNSSILSINAGEHWLGIGAADNSMSLFHRPSNAGTKVSGWQLYRVPQKTAAVVWWRSSFHMNWKNIFLFCYWDWMEFVIQVRCVASDLERKRICSGGRNGVLRLWDATINIWFAFHICVIPVHLFLTFCCSFTLGVFHLWFILVYIFYFLLFLWPLKKHFDFDFLTFSRCNLFMFNYL